MKNFILMFAGFCIIGHSSLMGQHYTKMENLKWNEITLDEKNWQFENNIEIVTLKDNPSIKIEGKAVSKIKLEGNFSIEIRFKNASSPAIFFNKNDLANYEEVYLRIFRSGMPEAIQYIPVMKGFVPWRMYGFGTLTGSATFSYFRYAKIDSEIKINLPKKKGIISEWKVSQAFNLFQEASNIGQSLEKFGYPGEKILNTVVWENI